MGRKRRKREGQVEEQDQEPSGRTDKAVDKVSQKKEERHEKKEDEELLWKAEEASKAMIVKKTKPTETETSREMIKKKRKPKDIEKYEKEVPPLLEREEAFERIMGRQMSSETIIDQIMEKKKLKQLERERAEAAAMPDENTEKTSQNAKKKKRKKGGLEKIFKEYVSEGVQAEGAHEKAAAEEEKEPDLKDMFLMLGRTKESENEGSMQEPESLPEDPHVAIAKSFAPNLITFVSIPLM